MTWSMATRMKLIVMISITGRRPIMAAPMPAPMKPSSEIGVSRTRTRPVLLPEAGRDLVGALEAADLLAHQEHVRVAAELLVERLAQRLAVGHVGHVRSSPRSPKGAPDAMRENCSARIRVAVEVVVERVARRERRLERPGDRILDLGGDVLPDRIDVGRRERCPRSASSSPKRVIGSRSRHERISSARAVHLARVGHRVAAEAVGHRLEQRGLALVAGLRQQASGGLAHGQQVVSIDPLAVHAVGGGALARARARRRTARPTCPSRTGC